MYVEDIDDLMSKDRHHKRKHNKRRKNQYNDLTNLSTLDRMIEELKMSDPSSSCYLPKYELKYKHVPDKQGLFQALTQLKNHIGNDTIKDQMTKQIESIIKEKFGEIEKNQQIKPSMKNICIYGPPGVGKTTIAKIIGKALICCGALTKPRWDTNHVRRVMVDKAEHFEALIPILIAGFFVLSTIARKIGPIAFIVLLTLLVIGLIMFYSTFDKTSHITEYVSTSDEKTGITGLMSNQQKVLMAKPPDFIAGYVGQTESRTKEFLDSNRGSVIIIDETYEFASNDKEVFAKKALALINTEMSERPGESIFIFIGYRDKMLNSVFTLQEGLNRRFPWHFDCNGYSKDELFSIYKKMLGDRDMKIKSGHSVKSREIFNTFDFRNFAGDVENVVSKISDRFNQSLDFFSFPEIKEIKAKYLKEVIEQMRESGSGKSNLITNSKSVGRSQLSEILRNFGVPPNHDYTDGITL
ncbi:MAG: AAA family ATPase [Bacteroidetes bacterium]|nr:AAA family ATPase [Bacteroidota bacterium]